MSHPARHSLGRLALPLIASLGLGLAALPSLGTAHPAHAAATRQVAHAHISKAKHAKVAHTLVKVSAITPPTSPAPSGAGVVTSCTSTGLLYALDHYTAITFACPAPAPGSHYTIDLGDQFEVPSGEALTIDGSDGGRDDVAISGGATPDIGSGDGDCEEIGSPTGHRIFLVDFGGALTLRNLTLADGYADDDDGGAVLAFGTLTADRDTFVDNGAEDAGGALELATDSPTSAQTSAVTNSTFEGNYAYCDTGGAIDVDDDGDNGPQQVALGHDTFTNNTAYDDDGGAVSADNDNPASMLQITDSVFRGNEALGDEDDRALPAAGGTVRKLDDEGSAGGAVATYDQAMHIGRTLFDTNFADGVGGAVYVGHGEDVAALVIIDRSTFVGNAAFEVGGAVYDEGELNLTNDTITQNSAGEDGSAIFYAGDEGHPLAVAASTINDNLVYESEQAGVAHPDQPEGGAGIGNDGDGGTFSVGTSIVYNNTYVLTDLPIIGPEGRTARARVAALHAAASSIRARLAPVHASVLPVGTVLECDGKIKDNGANLSDYDLPGTPTATNSCGFTQPPDILVPEGTDAAIGLGSLGAYGGPILGAPGDTSPTYTERLLKGSPAIDAVPAGSCKDAAGGTLPTDERSFVRPYVALCDIGAFEVSTLAVGNGSGTCGVVITFHAPGGTQFALRTGDGPSTLLNYLSINGPGGLVQALPLVISSAPPVVPNPGAVDTLSCTFPDPAGVPPATTTTVTVDARVVRSRNASIPAGTLVRVVAVRTGTSETVTVSAINPDNSTGATLYTLTPFVQPQSFVVAPGPFILYSPPLMEV